MANDAALQATAAQLRDSRYQADTWLNVTLPPMMKLWKGIGNIRASNFFISEEDARQAKGAYVDSRPFRFAESLWRMGQVQKDPKHDYRGKIAEFVVDFPTEAAVGICLANPVFGVTGGLLQYFIPDWQRTLRLTGRTYRFEEKSYPSL